MLFRHSNKNRGQPVFAQLTVGVCLLLSMGAIDRAQATPITYMSLENNYTENVYPEEPGYAVFDHWIVPLAIEAEFLGLTTVWDGEIPKISDFWKGLGWAGRIYTPPLHFSPEPGGVAVPEPSSLILLAIGLAGMIAVKVTSQRFAGRVGKPNMPAGIGVDP